jgi:O-acetyl-ADP-ribose deacetylase (regulator of RNase III)
MITYVIGDLFQSPAKVLVNAVNTVGVMGAGIAAQFKSYYPEMFAEYQALCRSGRLQIGALWLYKTPHKWVLNLPTKKHWRAITQPEYIEAGLQKFAVTYAEKGITSVSFPMLGGGKGNLDWDSEVRPIMEAYLAPLPITVYIHRYERDNPFAARTPDPRTIRVWLHGQPLRISFSKFWRDLVRLVKRQDRFETLDGANSLQAAVEDDKRRSLILTLASGDTLFFSESMLVDLWTYLRGAGYCLPHNLPGGLDVHAPYVFPVLAGLEYVRPVLLSPDDKARYVGLHIVSPLERRPAPPAVKLTM